MLLIQIACDLQNPTKNVFRIQLLKSADNMGVNFRMTSIEITYWIWALLGLLNTWMGDHLGTADLVGGFPLFPYFFSPTLCSLFLLYHKGRDLMC